MTSLVIEQFAAPDTDRKARALELVRRRAADQLAGRTVWSLGAARTGTAAADMLQRSLRPVEDDGVTSQKMALQVGEPLRALIERLDSMMRGTGRPARPLGRAAQDTYSTGKRDADALIPGEVRVGDIVVLHDPIAAVLAEAIREHGAHAVWSVAVGRWEVDAAVAWQFLHRRSPGIDAYITAWRPDPTSSAGRAGIAAFIAARPVVSAKERAFGRDVGGDALDWTSLLADVVRDDRGERVGGTRHARPSVASR